MALMKRPTYSRSHGLCAVEWVGDRMEDHEAIEDGRLGTVVRGFSTIVVAHLLQFRETM